MKKIIKSIINIQKNLKPIEKNMWREMIIMIKEIIEILDKNKSIYDGFIAMEQWKDIVIDIQSAINKKFKLLASGKVKYVGKPEFGIYDGNVLISLDIGEYNDKNISIYISENR